MIGFNRFGFLLAIGVMLLSLSLTLGKQPTVNCLLLTAGLGIVAYLLGIILQFIVYFIPTKDDEMEIKQNFKKVIAGLSNFKSTNYLGYLKLGILLMELSGKQKIEFRKNVEAYIQVLTAGLMLANKEWFATYTIPIETWEKFGPIAETYLEALKKARINKNRVVIFPKYAVNLKHVAKTRLVQDTINVGATIDFIQKENIDPKIVDFALYDNNLVIVGEIKEQTCTLKTPTKIMICKGQQTAIYKSMKECCLKAKKQKTISP